MNKVLIISYYWPPSGGAGVQRWLKFVKYLPQEGIEPIVLTIHPEFAAYPVLDESFKKDINPELKIHKTKATDYYKLYSVFKRNKQVPHGGIPPKSKSFKIRLSLALRNHFFIPDPRIGWNKYAFKKAMEIIQKESIKTVITTSPPHSTQLIGLKVKKAFPNINWVADLRDPWTDIYFYKNLNHSRWSDRQNRKKEKMVLLKADELIVVSQGMKDLFINKGLEGNRNKIHVIPNGYDSEDFILQSKISNERATISYIGTLNDDYDISGFIDALVRISNENENRIEFQFLGQLPKNIETAIESAGLKGVLNYKGYVEHSEAVKHAFSSDLLLLVVPNVTDNKGIITGKLFEYIATGNPIICLGPKNGDAAMILREGGFGECFDYSDVNAIYEFLQRCLIEKSITSGNPTDRYKYSRKSLTNDLAKLLNRLGSETRI